MSATISVMLVELAGWYLEDLGDSPSGPANYFFVGNTLAYFTQTGTGT